MWRPLLCKHPIIDLMTPSWPPTPLHAQGNCVWVFVHMADWEHWVITLSINVFICWGRSRAFLGDEKMFWSTLLRDGAQTNAVIRSLSGEQCVVKIMSTNHKVKTLNTQSIRLMAETVRDEALLPNPKRFQSVSQWTFWQHYGRVSEWVCRRLLQSSS